MGFPGLNTITLQKGQAYELHIYSDAFDQGLAPHTFSGIPGPLNISGGTVQYQHGNELVRRFTPNSAGSFFFNCDDTGCSDASNIANEHDLMHGWINVQ
jgi:hypothetical protein